MSREDLDPKAWVNYNDGILHFTDVTSVTSSITANQYGLVLNTSYQVKGGITGDRIYTSNLTPLLDGELISKSHLDSQISNHTHDDRYYTETEIDAFFNVTTGHDHDGVNSGVVNHNNLSNIGTNSHSTIDSHIGNTTIHFTRASLGDLSVTSGLGTHTGDATIHYTKSSINLDDLGDVVSSSPSTNDILDWNGANWVPISRLTITGGAGDASATGSISSVAYYSSTKGISSDTLFIYDHNSNIMTVPTILGTLAVSGARHYMTTVGYLPQSNNELTTKLYVDTMTAGSISSGDYVSLTNDDMSISGEKYFMYNVHVGIDQIEFANNLPTESAPQFYVKTSQKFHTVSIDNNKASFLVDRDFDISDDTSIKLFNIFNSGISDTPLNSSIRVGGSSQALTNSYAVMGNCTKVTFAHNGNPINWDNQSDTWGNAEFSSSRFIALKSGKYLVHAQVTVLVSSPTKEDFLAGLAILIYKNSSPYSSKVVYVHNATTLSASMAHAQSIDITDMIHLNASDVIEIYLGNHCKNTSQGMSMAITTSYNPCTEDPLDSTFFDVVKIM